MNPPSELDKRLSAAKSPADYARALRRAYSDLDRLTEDYVSSHNVNLACKKGCSLCCYMRVDAKAHEVLLIGDHVESTFSEERKVALRERLIAHKRTVDGLTYIEHMSRNVACPLLEGGSCSVYEVRPFGCRRHQSESLARCEHSHANPEDLEYPGGHNHGLSRQSVEAEGYLQDAYVKHGFDTAGYELGTAVLEVLENKRIHNRWKARKRALIDAKRAER